MSWAIGFDDNWNRDVGYSVPSVCDEPGCTAEIDRGLGYVCGSDPYGGEKGCGLYFCGKHLFFKTSETARPIDVCVNCYEGKPPFEPKSDTKEWINHKLTDKSWQEWRDENPVQVEKMKQI